MPPKAKAFLQAWVITMVGVLIVAHVIEGISYDNALALLAATLLLGLLNAFVRPVLMLLSLPLVVLTLGLFMLVINAGLLWLVGELVKGFHVAGFWAAFKGSLLISLISIVLNTLTGSGQSRFQFTRRRSPIRRDPPPPSDKGGPIIDV